MCAKGTGPEMLGEPMRGASEGRKRGASNSPRQRSLALDHFKLLPVLSPGEMYQSIAGALEASGFASLTDCWTSAGKMEADPASCQRKAARPVSLSKIQSW